MPEKRVCCRKSFAAGRAARGTPLAVDVRVSPSPFHSLSTTVVSASSTGAASARRLAEEGSVDLSRLQGRQAGSRKRVDSLIGKVTLSCRQSRRSAVVPAQTRLHVCVESGALACGFVRQSVQLAHLLEQRLELLLVKRHNSIRTRGGARGKRPRMSRLQITRREPSLTAEGSLAGSVLLRPFPLPLGMRLGRRPGTPSTWPTQREKAERRCALCMRTEDRSPHRGSQPFRPSADG